jgi:hypothetical protein
MLENLPNLRFQRRPIVTAWSFERLGFASMLSKARQETKKYPNQQYENHL